MSIQRKREWIKDPLASAALRYGLAFASVAAALVIARTFLYFHLPQPFATFALTAIAITFWYGGAKPGILAALFACFVRVYLFEPEVDIVSRLLYNLVFLVFALLMVAVTRARDELEVRVAERTAELTLANEDLKLQIVEREQTERRLRQSEAYLAEAQRLARTGSWVWQVPGKEALHLSEEWFRIYGFDPTQGLPPWEKRLERVHPEDRTKWQRALDQAIEKKSEYEVEYRLLLADGTIKHIRSLGHPVVNASGALVQFVGSSTDITERKQTEETLRQAQVDLAHVSRATTMGELTASLAHEVNQPIAAAVTDASTCARWLTRDHPDLEEAREAASRVVKDATRAAEIISRIRLLFKKGTVLREPVDVNEVVQEMIALLRSEITRYSISVQTELAADLPRVLGDRVQLQQVLMNLMINSMDAMKDVDGARVLAIQSQLSENKHVVVSVNDTGVGLPANKADEIFNAFFTTKPHGTGMGLRISRSIIESHGGRLWAAANSGRGASFCFSLPFQAETHE
jgi:PAS domain S-box-containing protein